MRQIAIYGKGGIGKSTITAHLTCALAARGLRVLQVGCDPKHDSTRLLLNGRIQPTVLDRLRAVNFRVDDIVLDDVVQRSACAGTIWCAESGGPGPGVGCGGKGVAEAIATLRHLDVYRQLAIDVVLYDVLGDVVCGGFSMPIREGYADEIYIVTSGELEVLFAAANICKAVARFNSRSGAGLGGLIANLRNVRNEITIVEGFAALVGTRVAGCIPYSERIKRCSGRGQPLSELYPQTPEHQAFDALAATIWDDPRQEVPGAIGFEQLHAWWRTARMPAT